MTIAPTKQCNRCIALVIASLRYTWPFASTRMTYTLIGMNRKCNRSESCERSSNCSNYESWKSVSGESLSAIATSFWKIERAVWSSGNIPFTVLTSFNFKVVIAERVTKKNLLNLAGNRAQHIQSYLSNKVRVYNYKDCAKYHFYS